MKSDDETERERARVCVIHALIESHGVCLGSFAKRHTKRCALVASRRLRSRSRERVMRLTNVRRLAKVAGRKFTKCKWKKRKRGKRGRLGSGVGQDATFDNLFLIYLSKDMEFSSQRVSPAQPGWKRWPRRHKAAKELPR